MIVLMDMEWITNDRGHICPTQIAAQRVTDQWFCLDSFFARMCPRDSTFYQWDHVAFSGGKASDFMYAKKGTQVLNNLLNWLLPDDIICFWHPEGLDTFKRCCKIIIKQEIRQETLVLREYLLPFLAGKGIRSYTPYDIARELYIKAAMPKHHAKNDVAVIQSILQMVRYKAKKLRLPPPQANEEVAIAKDQVEIDPAELPFQQEVDTGLFHVRGCVMIPEDAELLGFKRVKYFKRKSAKYCPKCMRENVNYAFRNRNKQVVESTEYHYIYEDGSKVFHRRDCGLVLGTHHEIRGCIYYDSAVATGRRPCKCCNPSPDNWVKIKRKSGGTNFSPRVVNRPLNAEELRALERFQRARDERNSRADDSFTSEVERNDFYTLTQPRFAFWAAAGFATFHTRDCTKLRNLSGLVGFPSCQCAKIAGYTPCKCCRPNKKQDMVYSIPITSRNRGEENIADIKKLCRDVKFRFYQAGNELNIETPCSKWKIDARMKPYVIYHSYNKAVTNAGDYHRQPRMFLSLLDIFEYIHRHDCREDHTDYLPTLNKEAM